MSHRQFVEVGTLLHKLNYFSCRDPVIKIEINLCNNMWIGVHLQYLDKVFTAATKIVPDMNVPAIHICCQQKKLLLPSNRQVGTNKAFTCNG